MTQHCACAADTFAHPVALACVEQARKEERELCVAELENLARDSQRNAELRTSWEEVLSYSVMATAMSIAACELKKKL